MKAAWTEMQVQEVGLVRDVVQVPALSEIINGDNGNDNDSD